jgi:hypothetical protein
MKPVRERDLPKGRSPASSLSHRKLTFCVWVLTVTRFTDSIFPIGKNDMIFVMVTIETGNIKVWAID